MSSPIQLPVKYKSLSPKDRREVRQQYIKLQKGGCYFCKMQLADAPSNEVQSAYIDESLFPENFFDWPEHLHHCHKTGMTIGVVHPRCNAYLWQYLGE